MVIPLGLRNTPRIFQKLMNSVFQEALDHFSIVYLDNIIMYLSSTSEHLQHIEWVLFKLQSNSLFAKPTKCEFNPTKLAYLGCIISSGTVKPNPKKIEGNLTVGFSYQCQRIASLPWFLQLFWLLCMLLCRYSCPPLCFALKKGYLALD